MIDNCYGEFVDKVEPLALGADVMVGSLIKNLGGGIAPNGAYIAGKKELVKLEQKMNDRPLNSIVIYNCNLGKIHI